MFFPMFIAILLGLVSPSNTSSNCTHEGTTVSTNSNTPGDPGNDPGDGDPGDDGTGGDTGQNPPR